MSFSILIPAYNPDEKLLSLVQSLLSLDVDDIIIVDDGSGDKEIFNELSALTKVSVIRHAVNMGKGRALKTGFNYYLCSANKDSQGIVTADADGQHSHADILNVGTQISDESNNIIIGTRRFLGSVPMRSKIGNIITKYIFKIIVGIHVSDTQSGLRGVPKHIVSQMLTTDGERYEYELSVLLTCRTNNIDISEIPISTIYIDDNKSSHFNPVVDSMKIYFVLLRFMSSSVVTVSVDFIVFSLVLTLTKSILYSFIGGRVISLVINFILNKSIVFKSRGSTWGEMVQYGLLVLLMGTIAYFSTVYLSKSLSINPVLAKSFVETILFVVNFLIQRDIVFTGNTQETLK